MALLLLVACLIAALPLLTVGVMRIRNVGAISPVELGIMFASIAAAYGLIPLIGYMLTDFSFDLSLDSRLESLTSTVDDVTGIAFLYAAFLLGFSCCYGLLRPRHRGFEPGDVEISDWRMPAILVLLAIFVTAIPALLKRALGVEASQDYLGTYLELENQPLWIRQLLGLAIASGTTLVTAAIASVVVYKRQLVPLVAGVLAIGVVLSLAMGGSRTLAMSALLSGIVVYSLAVRPISMSKAMLAALVILGVFVGGQYLRDFLSNEDVGGLAGFLVNGEFASIFVNGLDMMQQREWLRGSSVLPNFYVVDFARLIPQQLLPFEKVDPSRWYVVTFYPGYAETGGGLAFGAIAESAVGFGTSEALVRGGLLGAVFAYVHGALTVPSRRSFVSLVAYVWLVVFCYQGVRDTTFSLVARFVFNALPALLVVVLIDRLLRYRSSTQ